MTSQRSMIDQWRTRLTEYERELNDPAGSPSWLVSAYANVLRFLLAFYGDSDAATSELIERQETIAVDASLPSTAALYESGGIGAGKPAKDISTIRATLATVHKSQGVSRSPGPLHEGLRPDDPVCVLSHYSPDEAQAVRDLLHEAGIKARVYRSRQLYQVHVPASARECAKELLAENAIESRIQTPPRILDPVDAKELVEMGLCNSVVIWFVAAVIFVAEWHVPSFVPLENRKWMLVGELLFAAIACLVGGLSIGIAFERRRRENERRAKPGNHVS
jgi:hypothetical protein